MSGCRFVQISFVCIFSLPSSCKPVKLFGYWRSCCRSSCQLIYGASWSQLGVAVSNRNSSINCYVFRGYHRVKVATVISAYVILHRLLSSQTGYHSFAIVHRAESLWAFLAGQPSVGQTIRPRSNCPVPIAVAINITATTVVVVSFDLYLSPADSCSHASTWTLPSTR